MGDHYRQVTTMTVLTVFEKLRFICTYALVVFHYKQRVRRLVMKLNRSDTF